jgi:peptidoglycan/LPS O-acetylase OafA/YrhL
MYFHYIFGFTAHPYDLSVARYGNMGVQLFFIISGFVIAQSIATTSIKNFAIGRFIRLAPMFWLICTLTYIFTLLMPNGHPVRFPEYLISMTMLGDKFSSLLGYGGVVDPVYWSLAVEIIFYVAIACFVYVFSWNNIRYFLWGWLMVSAMSFLLHIDQNFFVKFLLVRHASYFIIGATLSLLVYSTYTSHKQKISDYLLLAITTVYSTLISYVALPPYFVPNPLDDTIIACAHPVFVLTVILFIYISKYLRSKKVIRVCAIIGGLTYPLYLVHQTVGRTLITYFDHISTVEVRAYITMVFIIVLSYIFYVIDKQVRAYLRTTLLPGRE